MGIREGESSPGVKKPASELDCPIALWRDELRDELRDDRRAIIRIAPARVLAREGPPRGVAGRSLLRRTRAA